MNLIKEMIVWCIYLPIIKCNRMILSAIIFQNPTICVVSDMSSMVSFVDPNGSTLTTVKCYEWIAFCCKTL